MATKIRLDGLFGDLTQLFAAVETTHRRRPTVGELKAAAVRADLRDAGVRAMCIGRVPTRTGTPRTTIARDESEVVW